MELWDYRAENYLPLPHTKRLKLVCNRADIQKTRLLSLKRERIHQQWEFTKHLPAKYVNGLVHLTGHVMIQYSALFEVGWIAGTVEYNFSWAPSCLLLQHDTGYVASGAESCYRSKMRSWSRKRLIQQHRRGKLPTCIVPIVTRFMSQMMN